MGHATPATEPLLLNLRLSAELLGVSIWQVRQLAKSGALPSTKIGNRIYIPAKALREFGNAA